MKSKMKTKLEKLMHKFEKLCLAGACLEHDVRQMKLVIARVEDKITYKKELARLIKADIEIEVEMERNKKTS